MRNEKNIEIFRQWLKFHCAHDLESMKALLTDDVIVRSSSTPGTKTFAADYKAKALKKFQAVYNAFDDFKMEEVSITSENDVLFAEIDQSGTMTGKLKSDEPTGKSYKVRGAFKFDFENKKIKSIISFWNKIEMDQQLGLPIRWDP